MPILPLIIRKHSLCFAALSFRIRFWPTLIKKIISFQFDVSQVFTKPIILLQGVENVTKILQLFSLKYNLYVKIQKNLSYYSVAVSTVCFLISNTEK